MNVTSNFGATLDNENWEVRIYDNLLSSQGSISPDRRAFPHPGNNHVGRGLVIWDKNTNHQVFAPAIGALDILADMREVESWKESGLVVGVPALTSCPEVDEKVNEEILHTPFVRQNPEYVLSDPLRVTREQSRQLFEFLLENEQLLRKLAERDAVIAKKQMRDLFAKIAEYGRRKRLKGSE